MIHSHINTNKAQASELATQQALEESADADLSQKFSDALNGSAEELSAEEAETDIQRKNESSDKSKSDSASGKDDVSKSLLDSEKSLQEERNESNKDARERANADRRSTRLDHRLDRKLLKKRADSGEATKSQIEKRGEKSTTLSSLRDAYLSAAKGAGVEHDGTAEAQDRFEENQELLADDINHDSQEDFNQIEEEAVHLDNELSSLKAGVDSQVATKNKPIIASRASRPNASEMEEATQIEEARGRIDDELEVLEKSVLEEALEDDELEDADSRRSRDQEKNSDLKIDGTSIDRVMSDSGMFGDSNREGGQQQDAHAALGLELEGGGDSLQQELGDGLEEYESPVGHRNVASTRGRLNASSKRSQQLFDLEGMEGIVEEEEASESDLFRSTIEAGGEEADLDESFVKTSREEDEDLEDATRGGSNNELAEGAVTFSSQGQGASSDSQERNSGSQHDDFLVEDVALEGDGDFLQEESDDALDAAVPVGSRSVKSRRGRSGAGGDRSQRIFDLEGMENIFEEEEARQSEGIRSLIEVESEEVDLDESFVKTGREEDEELEDASRSGSNHELAEGAVTFSSQGQSASSDSQERNSGGQHDGLLVDNAEFEESDGFSDERFNGALDSTDLDESFVKTSREGNEELEDVSLSHRELAEGAAGQGQGASVGDHSRHGSDNRQMSGDGRSHHSGVVKARSSGDARARMFDYGADDGARPSGPEVDGDPVLRLSEEGAIDVDESLIKTGWDEDEELDDAFGVVRKVVTREDSLAGAPEASLSREQSDDGGGHHPHFSEWEQSESQKSNGSIFGVEESLDENIFQKSFDLEELELDESEIDESESVGLPADLISVDGPAVAQEGTVESLPQPTNVEEALEALAARILVSVPEKGGHQQVAMFFKELGPFKSLQITLLRESGRLVVIVQGMDAQTEAAIKGEASRLLGELKRCLQSGPNDENELVEIRGRSGKRNQDGEFDEWYIHDESDEKSDEESE